MNNRLDKEGIDKVMDFAITESQAAGDSIRVVDVQAHLLNSIAASNLVIVELLAKIIEQNGGYV